jgi:hypothetical protein
MDNLKHLWKSENDRIKQATGPEGIDFLELCMEEQALELCSLRPDTWTSRRKRTIIQGSPLTGKLQ